MTKSKASLWASIFPRKPRRMNYKRYPTNPRSTSVKSMNITQEPNRTATRRLPGNPGSSAGVWLQGPWQPWPRLLAAYELFTLWNLALTVYSQGHIPKGVQVNSSEKHKRCTTWMVFLTTDSYGARSETVTHTYLTILITVKQMLTGCFVEAAAEAEKLQRL